MFSENISSIKTHLKQSFLWETCHETTPSPLDPTYQRGSRFWAPLGWLLGADQAPPG